MGADHRAVARLRRSCVQSSVDEKGTWMSRPWRQYQKKVADFFSALECEVAIEKKVAGVRGAHVIDVVATRTIFGIDVTWVVECKFWRSPVTKEKVLALAQIASDVGADRAFLLSESGFQPGAVRVANSSNITLTSIDDLRENARPELEQLQCKALGEAFHRLQSELHALFGPRDYASPAEDGGPNALDLLADVFEIKTIALPHAQSREFPVSICGQQYGDVGSFIRAAEMAYSRVTGRLGELRALARVSQTAVASDIESFVKKVTEFLEASEAVLYPQDQLEMAASSMEGALAHMKAVGVLADALHGALGDTLARQPITSVMRALIDGPYLLLANQEREKQRWVASRRLVERALGDVIAAVR